MGWGVGAAGDVAPFVSAGYPSGTSHIACYISVASLIMFENQKLYRVVFQLFLPIFSSKMKNYGQPIKDSVP